MIIKATISVRQFTRLVKKAGLDNSQYAPIILNFATFAFFAAKKQLPNYQLLTTNH